jgi:GWxTD domain-containing protein
VNTPRTTACRALLVLLTFVVLSFQEASGGLPAPLTGEGDLAFSVDLPVFPTNDDGGRVDLAVMLYHPEMHFEPQGDGTFVAVVELYVKLARQGVIAVEDTQHFQLRADSSGEANSASRFQLLETSYPLEEGRWAVTVRVRDLARERAETVPNPRASEATGVLLVPSFPEGVARLSDPEFRIGPLANPERLFGVGQDTLEAYLEITRADPERAYVVDVEVFDPIYGGMDRQSIVLEPTGDRAATLYQLPLGTFPEGSYLLRLTPRWAPETETESEFGVSWRMDRVVQSARDLRVEAILMLDAEELEVFDRLSRPAQLRRMQAFWDERDPTAGTTRNEVYERFQARVSHAQRQYGRYNKPGALTDRGRIYVKYGPPAEISVEVVPLNAGDLDDAIGQVHDTYQMDRPGTQNKGTVARTPQEIYDSGGSGNAIADRKRNLTSSNRERGFELWHYILQGDPLIPGYAGWAENVDLRFLFVDRTGSGDYLLEFTNLPQGY